MRGSCWLIVFSKDRPMQLQATLESFDEQDWGLVTETAVIYRATSPEFERGYELVRGRFPDVRFVTESDFKSDLLGLFQGDFTLFAADDDLVFGKLPPEILDAIDERTACFSLRLGLNITYCYSNDKPNTLADWKEDGEYIRWKWRKETLDFAYPLSVVSHVFRTSELRQFTEQAEFKNPNQYEGQLQRYLDYVRPEMVAYKQSRIVGVPANRVNESCANRNGLQFAYTTKELNGRLLAGERIAVEDINFSGINAAQQELPYAFGLVGEKH